MSSELDDLDTDLRVFISDAREIFHGESWDQVHDYLEQVWVNSGLFLDAAWAEIEVCAKSEWGAV